MDNENLNKEKSTSESRRMFLKSAGKFAIYTPPALLLMNKPSHATFSKTGGYSDYTYEQKKEFYSKLLNWFRSLFS